MFSHITTNAQRDKAFTMMRESATEYLDQSLKLLGLDLETFRHHFDTLGEIWAMEKQHEMAAFYWIEVRDTVLHIHAFIVDAPFRGHGLGGAMLKHIEDTHAADMHSIRLGVYKDNAVAIRLYEKHGYVKRQYLDDIGYHIMEKDLLRAAKDDIGL